MDPARILGGNALTSFDFFLKPEYLLLGCLAGNRLEQIPAAFRA